MLRRARRSAPLALVLAAALAVGLVPFGAAPASAVGSASTPGTYENDSPALTLTGTWNTVASSMDSGGTYAQLSTAGAAEITFAATGIAWTARKNQSSGFADVYLDGAKVTTVDLYSAATQYRQAVYSVDGLADGEHTLRIVRTGTKNDSAIGRNITLDSVVVSDITPPSAPTSVTATAEGTGARVGWTASPESDVTGYQVFRAASGGSEWARLTDDRGVSGTDLLDEGLAPGGGYSYQVAAVDAAGNVSPRSATASVVLPQDAVAPGTYENDSAAVTLSGGWSAVASSMDSGGSYSQLGAAGYAEISFTGTGVSWIARKNQSSGTADVLLDGTTVATVDLYAGTTAYRQVVYRVDGLADGVHTLRVVRTGAKNDSAIGRNITLDSFVIPDITAPATPADVSAVPESTGARVSWSASADADTAGYRVYRAVGTDAAWTEITPAAGTTELGLLDESLQPGTGYRYQVVAFDGSGNTSVRSASAAVTTAIDAVLPGTWENDSAAVTRSGPWTVVSSSMDSGGSYSQLGAAGYAELSFTGTGVSWLARKNASSGIAEVLLDGVSVATVDLYSASTQYRQTAYRVDGLTDTTHTLRVVRTGTKSEAASGRNITLDAFVVPDVTAPSPPTDLTATQEGTGARISWTASPEPDVAGYEVYRATESTFARISPADGVSGTSHIDSDLQPGVTYSYQLTAFDASGNTSARTATTSTTMALRAVPPGLYEDGSSAITTTGTWTTVSSTMDSGGSYAQLTTAGYAELSFEGTGISWTARRNSSSGIAEVLLDGRSVDTVDLYSASTQYRQTVYRIDGLADTAHTLRIVRTGTKNAAAIGRNITLDSLVVADVTAPSTPTGVAAAVEGTGARISWTASPEKDVTGYRVYRAPSGSSTWTLLTPTAGVAGTDHLDDGLQPGGGYSYQVVAVDWAGNASARSASASVTMPQNAVPPGTYENDSSAVTLSGTWGVATSPVDSAGSYSQLTTAGYAELSFTGTGVSWIARKNSSSGIAEVFLDGKKVASVDLYSSTTLYQQTVYRVAGLRDAVHTIRVVRTGTKSDEAIGRNITLDAFVVPDVTAPAAATGLVVGPEGTGARISWTASRDSDVAGYRLLRTPTTSSTWTPVQSALVTATSYYDAGLTPSGRFKYKVIAVDTSGNESPGTPTASLTAPAMPVIESPALADCPAATVTVSTSAQLKAALSAAKPGTAIRLAAGVYTDSFTVSKSGTAAAPVWICGGRDAVLDAGSTSEARALLVSSVSHVKLVGFTVRNSTKGVMVVGSDHVVVSHLKIQNIGDEGIHLRSTTTDSVVSGNTIDRTGRVRPLFGEGIYVGTAEENRCTYSDCLPDASNRNIIAGNTITNTTSEAIEAKAGTFDGWIVDNSVDSSGMGADHLSPLVILGNSWVVTGNTVVTAHRDGIQVYASENAFGWDNEVFGNSFGTAPSGYFARMTVDVHGNIVGCDNDPGAAGVSNLACQN
ncbi:fibronectin type III domain-containing protein [Rathayibacter festucae]|uniref:fibronectin type III domain-containing protein n=1 Tax=Rathayibacter festucae TaxID=110937 RepID=UPI002A69C0D1|nr:fibronectin type III domain-containing protein [Rathayibacter festucae]MDY0911240.1 fibronectin type III domain-containing protein [Rathayibacter festucae]